MSTEPEWVREELVSLGEYAAMTLRPETDGVSGTSGARRRDPVEQRTRALEMARRRSGHFPAVRGGAGRMRTYRLGDLFDYTRRHERTISIDVVPAEWMVRRAVDRVTGSITDSAVVGNPRLYAIGAIAAGGARRRPPADALRHLLGVELEDRSWRELLDSAVAYALTMGADPGHLIDAVLNDTPRRTRAPIQVTSTSSGLAELLAAAANPPERARVFDPAAGEGSLLLSVSELRPDCRLYGQESDPSVWAVAAARAAAHGVDVDLNDRALDSFEHDPPESPFDVVIVDPPMSDTSAWLELALRHTCDGGRTVIALDAKAPDQHWALLSEANRSAVKAIVVTPDRLRMDHTGFLAVWVLEPGRRGGKVRIIDARSAGVWTGSRKRVSQETAQEVSAALRASTPPEVGLPWVDVARREAGDALAAGIDALFPVAKSVRDRAAAAHDQARKLRRLIESEPLLDHVTEEHKRALRRLERSMNKLAGDEGSQ